MRKRIAVAVLATGLATAGAGACEVEDSATTDKKDNGVAEGIGSKDAAKDVKLGELSTPYDTAEVPVTITNHSSKPSDYWVEAKLLDSAGVQVGTASTYVQRVAPKGTATSELTSLDADSGTATDAKLTVVDRTASHG